ncbi:hypothetical protein [Halorubellus sp. PRR65]|uniref:hypothetical protein n=1 Tax=Halorubellus sp. PRR65 TaxID=3098148 RepID=UPI002B25A712|nr:hypothetical protein [Halorubellus sp. PRR65]
MTSRTARVREHLVENRETVLADLAFAVVWVAAVTLLFDVLQGPQWVYHLTLAGGVVAHYGFFSSLDAAVDD